MARKRFRHGHSMSNCIKVQKGWSRVMSLFIINRSKFSGGLYVIRTVSLLKMRLIDLFKDHNVNGLSQMYNWHNKYK